MAALPLIVFDVSETLLDLATMEPIKLGADFVETN
jgi:hypothetical protein